MKLALYEIDKKYKIVAEVHDQIIVESRQASNDVVDLQNIMVREMKKVIPDVKVQTEGQILDRWCK